jgi:short-subunit dehydrogenase
MSTLPGTVKSAGSVSILVTGASRGFGRAVAIALCNHHLPPSHNNTHYIQRKIQLPQIHIVLVARSRSGLQETTQQIMDHRKQQRLSSNQDCSSNNTTRAYTPATTADSSLPEMKNASSRITTTAVDNIKISQIVADLGNMDTLDTTIDQMISCWENNNPVDGNATRIQDDTADGTEQQQQQRFIFINNVGSIGHIGPCMEYPSIRHLNEAITLNVTNALWTSTRILQWATTTSNSSSRNSHSHSTANTNKHVTVVNISSLMAVQPFPTLATYSAGKAARDSFHTAMAHESSNITENTNVIVRILNYAPGPLETDMTLELRKASALDATLQTNVRKPAIDPNDSAQVLMQLLHDDTYTNGAHVDYYACI